MEARRAASQKCKSAAWREEGEEGKTKRAVRLRLWQEAQKMLYEQVNVRSTLSLAIVSIVVSIVDASRQGRPAPS